MEPIHVSLFSMFFMLLSFLVCIVIPVALAIYLLKKKKADFLPFLVGAGVFVVFALLLESLFHQLILKGTGSFGTTISSTLWMYGLYGGLAAGIFEETGRFFAYEVLLKKKMKVANSLMYGAGHGGIEAFLLVGLTMLSNLITSIMLRTGVAEQIYASAPGGEEVWESLRQLETLSPFDFGWGGFERLIVMTLHIVLSVFVYMAVKNKKWYYYPIAIAIHTFINFMAVMMSAKLPTYAIELGLLALLLPFAFWGYKAYRKQEAAEQTPATSEV